jgi:hypothetical protein
MGADDPDELVWHKLTHVTLDGIEVSPLGVAADLEGLPATGVPGAAPYTRGATLTSPGHGWDVRAHLADTKPKRAAADALLDLENGATSLWLSLGPGGLAVADLPRVLQEVYVEAAPVVLDCPTDPLGAAEAFCALLAERGVQAEVAGILLDADGHLVGQDFAERCLSISADQLRMVPRVVAVAGGAAKTAAVLAVARSGLITSLVTDRALAEAALAEPPVEAHRHPRRSS